MTAPAHLLSAVEAGQSISPHTGFKSSPVNHKDYLYRAVAPTVVTDDGLPATFRCPLPLPNYDQGEKPKCVATSLACVKSQEEESDTQTLLLFDDDGLYARIASPQGGACIRDGLDSIRTDGYQSVTDNKVYKIGSYAGVDPTDHEAVKHALFNQGILEGGFNVPRSFMGGGGKEFHAGDGAADDIVGEHAIAIVAWWEQGLTLHNSWGEEWGNHGEVDVSWDFIDMYFTEMWAVFDEVLDKPMTVPAPDRETMQHFRKWLKHFDQQLNKVAA